MSSGTGRRPDESMTLLFEVMHRPLDAGYAAAAQRRAEGKKPSVAGKALTLVLAVLIGLSTVVSVADLRAPRPDSREPLKARIASGNVTVQAAQTRVNGLQREVDDLTDSLLDGDDDSDRLRLLSRVTGVQPVTGPGMVVQMDDATPPGAQNGDPRATQVKQESRVLDTDLQMVCNGLWSAGAEAIAINGERLTSLTAIRGAGPAVLVNFRPLTTPYRIEVIGDPGRLQVGFARSAGGAHLEMIKQSYGVRASISSADRLTLPGYEASLRHARPVPSPNAPAATTPSQPPTSTTTSTRKATP